MTLAETNQNTILLHELHNPKEAYFIAAMEDENVAAQIAEPHRHTFYQAFVITSGRGQHYIDFTPYEVRPGALFFVAPGQVHFWEMEEWARGYVILFTREFIELGQTESNFLKSLNFYRLMKQLSVLYLPDDLAEKFSEWGKALLSEFLGDKFGRIQASRAILELFLIEAQRYAASQSSQTSTNQGTSIKLSFLELLESNFRNSQTVEEYAKKLGITADHLNDVIKSQTRQTASAFIHQRIVLETKRLLVHTGITSGEIAYELNFKDVSYFSRFFKRETGESPQTFRARFKSGRK